MKRIEINYQQLETKKEGITTTFDLPKDIIKGTMSSKKINEDISVNMFDINVKKDFIIQNKFEDKLFVLNVFLKDSMFYKNKDFKLEKEFKQNYLNMAALNCENGESFYKKDSQSKIVNIVIKKDFIDEYLSDSDDESLNEICETLNNKPKFHFLGDFFCDIETLGSVNSLFDLKFNEKLERLYIQSIVYDLLYKGLDQLSKKQSAVQLGDIEKEYLFKVKNYIDYNYEKELVLKDLAKIAATNETKLQNNFKLLFKSTVFQYILKVRMNKAKELLLNNDYSISEIANLVGYKYQGNFTNVFYKHFNILPKELRKKVNYYI